VRGTMPYSDWMLINDSTIWVYGVLYYSIARYVFVKKHATRVKRVFPNKGILIIAPANHGTQLQPPNHRNQKEENTAQTMS
jgi:hypothetical protein